jgi:hypothetical protein
MAHIACLMAALYGSLGIKEGRKEGRIKEGRKN